MNTYPRITIAQLEVKPLDIEGNLKRMFSCIQKAKDDHSEIVIFPELCISGYLLGDRFEYEDLLMTLRDANERVREASTDIVIIWGNIVCDENTIGEDGRMRKYNAVCIAENGQYVSNGVLSGYMPKTHLPKYRIFDDARHFYPAYKLAQEMGLSYEKFFRPFCITRKDGSVYSLALTVCEDMWEDEYQISLATMYAQAHVDLLIDISASPWTLGKWHARETMLTKRSKTIGVPLVYVNCVGLQNNGKNLVLFDGASVIVTGEGEFAYRAKLYDPTCDTIDCDPSCKLLTPYVRKSEIEELHDSLIQGIKIFYTPFQKIIIGLSGGIDSALMLALLVRALGSEKILAINMPTRWNSVTTKRLAEECAKRCGVAYQVVPIEGLYEEQVRLLTASGVQEVTTLTKENIQARLRGSVLATFASQYQGVFTCNGNKTEVAMNYFTLYGDGAGASAFLGDLWKGQVYALARYINSKSQVSLIPEGILTIVPSAELSDAQNVDEGKGDPIVYEFHDALLKAFCETRLGVKTLLKLYLRGDFWKTIGLASGSFETYFRTKQAFVDAILHAWNAYNTEYKRVQLPPVFLTSRRAFGFDRRDTIATSVIDSETKSLVESILSESSP